MKVRSKWDRGRKREAGFTGLDIREGEGMEIDSQKGEDRPGSFGGEGRGGGGRWALKKGGKIVPSFDFFCKKEDAPFLQSHHTIHF